MKEMATSIGAELYNEVIKGVRPLTISLVRCEFETTTGQHPGKCRVHALPGQVEVQEIGSNTYCATQSVSFEVVDSTSDTLVASGNCAVKVNLHFSVLPPDGFWPIFLKRNMPLYLNPAVRDLVSALCMRANILAEALPSIPVVPNLSMEKKVAPKKVTS